MAEVSVRLSASAAAQSDGGNRIVGRIGAMRKGIGLCNCLARQLRGTAAQPLTFTLAVIMKNKPHEKPNKTQNEINGKLTGSEPDVSKLSYN